MLYSLPFSGRNYISSPYGQRTVNGKSDFHRGLDIVGQDDKTVQAVVGGTVESSTIITNHNDLTWQWGNYVKVRGDDGLYWFYCHMDSRAVKVGQRVERGDKLGVMGNTGYSFGAHTHLEVRNSKKESINPCERLGIPNAAGVTYDTNKIDISTIIVMPCTKSSYRWRTGIDTNTSLYYDRNGAVSHCMTGTDYRVYDIRKDNADSLWCQITPPTKCTTGNPPELWVSSECFDMAAFIPNEPDREEHNKPEVNKPKEIDWNSPCNEFVVSVTGADRVRLRQLCDELQLHVENLY